MLVFYSNQELMYKDLWCIEGILCSYEENNSKMLFITTYDYLFMSLYLLKLIDDTLFRVFYSKS